VSPNVGHKSHSLAALPVLHTSDSPVEMDPSVLHFARPGQSTESLPVSPSVRPQCDEVILSPQPVSATVLSGRARQRASTFTAVISSEGDHPPSSPPPIPYVVVVDSPPNSAAGSALPSPPPSPSISPPAVVSPSSPPSASISNTQPQSSATPKSTPAQPAQSTKRRRDRSDSAATFHGGGAESIFRLLPRETRPALRRMLFVEPSARCTLTDLLKGRGKTSGLLCGCERKHKGGPPSPGGENGLKADPVGKHCIDHDDCDPEDEDDGDEWLRSIQPCSMPGVECNHTHIKVTVEEKKSGRRRFF
jgi:hypothetical protein